MCDYHLNGMYLRIVTILVGLTRGCETGLILFMAVNMWIVDF
jgi:hypothetical protein